MTLDSETFEVNRWHSSEYVNWWMADQIREADRRLLRKKLVSLLPFDPGAKIRVLDIGAGGGGLGLEIMSVYPSANLVCQDFSQTMLSHARQNLTKYTGQVTFVQSDLSASEWTRPISGEFDAVVSSLVMHTVPGRVSEIYREIFGLLKPNGCCLIADTCAPPGPIFEKALLKTRLKAWQARIKAETGIEKSLEEVEQELKNRRRSRGPGFPERVRNPLRRALTLVNQLEWLRQAGFDEVDCLWREMGRMIIAGVKHHNSEDANQ